MAGPVDVVWLKYRWFCQEPVCGRLPFCESSLEVPRSARSTGRLRTHMVSAVIELGWVVSETAAAFRVS
jgi:hypothetical protein